MGQGPSRGAAAHAWVKADDANAKYVDSWRTSHAALVDQWIKENPNTPEPKADDLAVVFFESFSKENPGTWLTIAETKSPNGETEKRVELVKDGDADIAAVFFDMWREAHPDVALELVPSDMVMASGSGLDPDITLKNALYQLPRVVAARTEMLAKEGKIPTDKARRADLETKIQGALERLLQAHAAAPLGGLAGVELVNVLEVNLALPQAVAEAVR